MILPNTFPRDREVEEKSLAMGQERLILGKFADLRGGQSILLFSKSLVCNGLKFAFESIPRWFYAPMSKRGKKVQAQVKVPKSKAEEKPSNRKFF